MLLLIAIIVGLGESLRAVGRHYMVAFDVQDETCLPIRVAVVEMVPPTSISRGELLAFRTDQARPYLTRTTAMGKRVAGLPGDRFSVRSMNFFLNGIYRGRLGLCEKKFVPRYCDDRDGVVADGQVLMLADHPDSFDGRYWGPMAQTDIIGRLIWPRLLERQP